MVKDLAKLTTTTDVASWIPADVYAGLIMEQAQAARLLAGDAAVIQHDITKGNGDTVQVKWYPKRTAQGPIAEGASLVDAVSTPKTFAIQLKKYGDSETLSHESIFQAGDAVLTRLLGAMGRGIARKIDEVVYSELKTATPGVSKKLAVKGDLTTSADFFHKIREAVDEGRAGKDVVYDRIYMGPDQVGALAQMKESDRVLGAAINVDSNGRPTSVYGLQIRDLFSIANRNTTTLSAVQAIIADSSRAWGEAYGRPATFEEQRKPRSDQYEQFVWADFGASELDTDGIAHIVNPSV